MAASQISQVDSRPHPALGIPEIVQQIFREFAPATKGFFGEVLQTTDYHEDDDKDDDNEGEEEMSEKECRHVLLQLSLVCRAFSAQAVDLLWSYMDDLTPLFDLLPRPKSKKRARSTSRPADLAKFDAYARRVRYYEMNANEKFSPSDYASILGASRLDCLLPRLRYLLVSELTSPRLTMYTPSTLMGVSILTAMNHPNKQELLMEINALVDAISNKAPRLHIMDIQSSLSQTCLPVVQRLSHLKHLRLGRSWIRTDVMMDPRYILDLASQSSLITLNLVRGFTFDPLPASWTPSSPTTFPYLQKLELTTGAPTTSILTTILSSVVCPQLEFLSVDVARVETSLNRSERNHWLRFFDLLPQMTGGSLKGLELTSRWNQLAEHWDQLAIPITSVTAFERLHLTSFGVYIPVFASATQEDIEKIVKMWPKLEHLRLGEDEEPLLNVSSLVFIAQTFKSLRSLCIPLDLEELPDYEEVPILRHSLKSIEIRCEETNCDEPVQFTRILDRLFPSLGNWDFHATSQEYGWWKAREVLELLQSARSSEVVRRGL